MTKTIGDGLYIIMGRCWHCGTEFAACADCVITIRIDPQTGYPPDVVKTAMGTWIPATEPISPDVWERCRQELVCDPCVDQSNKGRAHPLELAQSRHARVHLRIGEN